MGYHLSIEIEPFAEWDEAEIDWFIRCMNRAKFGYFCWNEI